MISFAKNVRDYISCVHLFVYFSPCAWCLTTMHLSVSQRGHGASQVKLPGAAAVLSFFCVVFCFFCSHTKKKNEFSNQDSGEGWCSLTFKKKRGTIFNGCVWCFCSLSTMLDHNAAIFFYWGFRWSCCWVEFWGVFICFVHTWNSEKYRVQCK